MWVAIVALIDRVISVHQVLTWRTVEAWALLLLLQTHLCLLLLL